MNNLAHAIRTMQRGVLSHKEFLAQVDDALRRDEAGSVRLISEALLEESTRLHLPPDVYGELQRRVEHLTEPRHSGDTTGHAEATRVLTGAEDHSLPQSATLANAPGSPAGDDAERIKGVGDTLNGRFVLEEVLGFGGMGTVYKALDLRKMEASDRSPYIAIKVLNVQFRGHPKSLIALQREAKKAQTLAHPNIVTVYDFDRDNSMVYLTMEYLSGRPLSQVLRAPDFKALPFAEAMRIVNGIGKALAYAHERGFVHCDLKPANVFLTNAGDVKVIDFGIARVFHKPEQDSEATVFDAGTLGGLTPAYASVEMLEHLEPDPRDDIYALGCITYELLTGRHPFDRVSALQARNAGMQPSRPPNLGHRQWRALKCALAFQREARTPSVARFLQDMSGERQTARYLVPAAASLAIGVALAAALNYYSNSRSEREPAAAPSASSAPSVASAAPEKSADAEVAPPPAPARPAAKLSLEAVAPVLAGVPCAALVPSIDGNALRVQGFLGQNFGAARLKQMLGAIPGAGSVSLEVRQVHESQCDVLHTFGPYWVKNLQAGKAAGIAARGGGELSEGDALVVDIKTPGYDSYVYVDYYVLDGHVAHLVPNPRARANQAPANYTAAVGSLGNWVIAKPFGNELILLLATPAPLFDGVRPEVESRDEYLRAVDRQLKQLAQRHGADHILADFVQITTSPRKK